MATFDVNANERNARLVGDGSLDTFSFSFQVNNTSGLKVYVDGVLKTETTDYDIIDSTATLGLNTDGTGTVRFVTAEIPAVDKIVSIVSDVPFSRSGVYTAGGNITAQALENDFDTIAMQVGDLKETASRAVTAPVSDPVNIDMTLPAKADRLNKILSFDATTGEPKAIDVAVSSASVGTVTTLPAGSSANVTATYDSVSGDIEFDFDIPEGSAGAPGNNGIFTAIASTAEAQAGTENTKGMTSLRVAEAITAQVSGVTAVASKFFGVTRRREHVTLHGQDFYRTILVQEHTLVGGSENLVLSNYDTYFFATGSVGLSLRSSDGHLLIDLP